ncbi:MAG: hypothetical protein K0R28_1143, partial [Paenibacillus sp.]|nr:hypothetical protein [Paenibacillus sp.]
QLVAFGLQLLLDFFDTRFHVPPPFERIRVMPGYLGFPQSAVIAAIFIIGGAAKQVKPFRIILK